MSVVRHRVSPLFRSGVAKCQDAGVVLTPEDVVQLWETSKAVIDGETDGARALIDIPVQVGNVTLYPRTCGSSIWWLEYGSKWFGSGTDDEIIAIAWMLANSRNPKLFRSITGKLAFKARLVAWQFGIASDVTLNELADGIERLCGRWDIDEETGEKFNAVSSVDWGENLATLCATYHRPADYFLWEISDAAMSELWNKRPPPPGFRRQSGSSSRYGEFIEAVRSIKARHKNGG